jgi:hypothetical protein
MGDGDHWNTLELRTRKSKQEDLLTLSSVARAAFLKLTGEHWNLQYSSIFFNILQISSTLLDM